MERYDQPHPRRWPWIIAGTLVSLFVLLLCYWSGLWSLMPPLRLWAINRVDQAEGQVDLVAPAGRAAGGGWLAPDGRHMVIGWDEQMVIWNLVTDERTPLAVDLESMGWLNAQQFVVQDDPRYYIVEAATGAVTEAELIPTTTYLKPGGFAEIAPVLRQAEQLYAVQGWGSDYKVFIWADQRWSRVSLSSYEMHITNDELTALLDTLDYTYVVRPGWETPAQAAQRLTSPDGQYIARWDRTDRAVIMTHDGTVIAQTAKYGWIPVILGWAHDSSGIYVQFWIRGAAGAVFVPEKPLFKLTPLTPAEARWQAVRRVATPVVIVGGIAGVGWWWRRRRTARG